MLTYMIPAAFLPVNHIPLGLSGKVDHKSLHAVVKRRSQTPRPKCAPALYHNRRPEAYARD